MQLRVLQDNLGPLLAVWAPPNWGVWGRLLRLCILGLFLSIPFKKHSPAIVFIHGLLQRCSGAGAGAEVKQIFPEPDWTRS